MLIQQYKQPCLSLFGASPDTGNQGVNALSQSVLHSLARRGVDRVLQFCYRHRTPQSVWTESGHEMAVQTCVANRTRRLYSPDSFFALALATRLNVLQHQASLGFLRSQAVLDISAGDSFTDLYGWERFLSVLAPKTLSIARRVPLILLPQTIGPFCTKRARKMARAVLLNATQVWARDEQSHALIRELTGSQFDPAKYRLGVDMAFGLVARRPSQLPEKIQAWITGKGADSSPIVGFNISGLIYNTPEESKEQFGLRADYCSVVREFADWLLSTSEARLLLVPHVLTPEGVRESDFAACKSLYEQLSAEQQTRVAILPADYGAEELKWIIGRTDWFCGSRMHSTIAALGSSVPAASLSYSMKTQGVFASCSMEESVIELRHLDTDDVLGKLKQAFLSRGLEAEKLMQALPQVKAKVEQQADEIVRAIYGESIRSTAQGCAEDAEEASHVYAHGSQSASGFQSVQGEP